MLLSLGMKDENIRLRDHEQAELSHYSNATTDIEFLFPFGWGELWGIADRTDFDLTQHQNHIRQEHANYFDQEANERYIPYVIEPSLGADRVALAFLCDAYDEEQVEAKDDVRGGHAPASGSGPLTRRPFCRCPRSCPSRPARSVEQLAGTVHGGLRRGRLPSASGTAAQDEIGTPFCITYDFESEEDGCVTVRVRDTMEQVRLPMDEVLSFIEERLEF